MRTTIDAAGRVVIPKKIRDAAGLRPGRDVEVRVRNGVVELEVPPMKAHLERRGAFLVIVPDEDVPPLTVEDVERIREEMWRERFKAITGMELDDDAD